MSARRGVARIAAGSSHGAGAGPDSRRGGVPGQHLHHRPPVRRARGDGAGRRLRRRLGELRPGRKRLRRLRPAVRRVGGAAGQRVPGQHLHDGPPGPSPPSRSGARGISSWSGQSVPGRFGLEHPRPALRRRGQRPRRRVPGQHLHDGQPVPAPRRPGLRWPVRRELDEPEADGSSYGIAARRFDASGNPIGSEFVVNTYTTGVQACGDLAVEADGSFVVVWEDYQRPRRLRLRHLRPALRRLGQPAGERVPGEHLHHRPPGASLRSACPRRVASWSPGPASSGTGAGMACSRQALRCLGERGGERLRRQHVHHGRSVRRLRAGRPRRPRQFRRHVARARQHGSIVRRLCPALQRFGRPPRREFRVNTYTTGDAVPGRRSPPMRWATSSSPGTAYGQDGSDVGDLRPALRRPGAGRARRRQPRQPGARAGRDGGRAAHLAELQRRRPDLQRHADQHHRPRGRHLHDHRRPGNYGTVAEWRRSAQCTDCYAVSVSNPPTRPAVHWDASAVESILPDTQGQQKQWLLHVGGSFTDVPPSSAFYRFVETLLHHGVTGGCSATSTARPARRRASRWRCSCSWRRKEPDTSRPPARRRCSPTSPRAVPSAAGSRSWPGGRWSAAAAAATTARPARSPASRWRSSCCARWTRRSARRPARRPIYNDVPATSPFCRWIEELTRRGVVTGCGGGNYCPTAAVTREQMGVFISVTFGLTLYGP